jgi:uncharacterized membrane protein HdeD (DUF308 family)
VTTFVSIWMVLFGIWPLAHPTHDATTLASVLDIAAHVLGGALLAVRWTVVRR